jgi:hypothetical protein
VSKDPRFVDKLRDVVGLYVDPPAHAIVLSVDEKSQIQALDRTQPGLPLKKGRAGTMTQDYVRHGTTTLFAAMNVLDGTVIGRNMQRHRHQEFIRFLNVIEKQVPAGKTIHAIVDNSAGHGNSRAGDVTGFLRCEHDIDSREFTGLRGSGQLERNKTRDRYGYKPKLEFPWDGYAFGHWQRSQPSRARLQHRRGCPCDKLRKRPGLHGFSALT